ncbi:MAG: type II toxin-antitoxin system RelE/ParE family toxin [Mesorhizobium sp.]|nr:type II toxin-antitoxin system RelE/ParE family toxin [Mesorhizobium sp.]
MVYILVMQVLRSNVFSEWFHRLRDKAGKARIARRLDRLVDGHFGDVRSVGSGVSEMRIDHGPGYRIYFARRGDVVVLLLCGGDKDSQSRDIGRAKVLADEWKD